MERPSEYADVNVRGASMVFEAAARAGSARVVFGSSSSVYGDTPTLPKIETMPPEPTIESTSPISS